MFGEGSEGLGERLRAGDVTALSTLVEQRFVSLVRVALIYLGERAEAFEVVREIERAAADQVLPLPVGAEPEEWLLRLLLDRLRARAAESGAPARTGPDPRTQAGSGRFADPGARPGAEKGQTSSEQVDPAELQDLVGEVISVLPLDQREVVILRDVERWPVARIARFAGRSENEVRRLLHRARSCILRATEQELERRLAQAGTGA